MDTKNCYSIELKKINNHLTELERGHIYELTKISGTPLCTILA